MVGDIQCNFCTDLRLERVNITAKTHTVSILELYFENNPEILEQTRKIHRHSKIETNMSYYMIFSGLILMCLTIEQKNVRGQDCCVILGIVS